MELTFRGVCFFSSSERSVVLICYAALDHSIYIHSQNLLKYKRQNCKANMFDAQHSNPFFLSRFSALLLLFIKHSYCYVIQCHFIHAQFKQIIEAKKKWIIFTCAIVATTKPNVNAICTILNISLTAALSPLNIVDATPTETKKNVPKNSANSIFHILRLFRMSLTPIIRLTPAKARRRKRNVNRENEIK